jgi:hypothetical protein
MSDFQKLLKYFENEYYGSLFIAFFELTAIITGFLFARRNKMALPFLFYMILDFAIYVYDIYLVVYSSLSISKVNKFLILSNDFISLVELLIYFYFFSRIIKNKVIINLMKILGGFLLIVTVLLETTKFTFLSSRLFYISNLINTLEFLFLLLPCFTYFYELLKDDPITNLYQRPSFWIVLGILFCSVISIPYLLIDRFVNNNKYEYANLLALVFFYLPFSLNFIFLTKAFLCKKTLTI